MLVRALDQSRWLEPRLTGGFKFSPCKPTPIEEGKLFSRPHCSPPVERDSASYGRLVKVGRTLEEENRKDVQGLWRLVWARTPEAVERSVATLEEAVEEMPDDAGLWSDLGAAYLVRARVCEKVFDLIRALDAVERALVVEEALPEALFNRYLILKEMGLDRAAYAESPESIGGNSNLERGWPTSNSRHRGQAFRSSKERDVLLKSLVSGDSSRVGEAVRLDPSFFRLKAMEELIPRMANLWIERKTDEASLASEVLQSLGEELDKVTGDRSVLDTVQLMSFRRGNSDQIDERLRIGKAFGEGRGLFRASRYEEAIPWFESVLSTSKEPGDPLSLWAGYWLAAIDSTIGNYPEALSRVQAIRRANSLKNLPALKARLWWLQALVEIRTGYFRSSMDNYEKASALYAEMGDRMLEGAALALAAESYRALGQHDEAWRRRLQAFRRLGHKPSGYLHNLYLDAASSCEDQGASMAALALQSLAVENAVAMDSASREVEAYLWRSKFLGGPRTQKDALADLDTALNRLDSVTNGGLRKRLKADLTEAIGRARLSENPAEAIVSFTETLDLYETIGLRVRMPSVYLARAKAEAALGLEGKAEKDLLAGIQEYERRDDHLGTDVFRYSHFEQAQALYDELIRLALGRKEPRKALVLAERARLAARRRVEDAELSFRGEPARRNPESERVDQLQGWMNRLPEGVVVVEYAVLPDQLVVWRVSRDDFQWWRRKISEKNLIERVREFSSVLERSADPLRRDELAVGLFDDLLKEAVSGLPQNIHLVVVADRVLAKVPFMALRDGQSNRYLVEDFVVSHSLGLSALVGTAENSNRAVRIGKMASSVALVGYAESPGDGLAELPGVEVEMDQLSRLVPGAQRLSGATVQRDAILEVLEQVEIFHFAGHGISDDARPWASYLSLAPNESGEEERLYAHDISGQAMSNLQLVVLSSCESAGVTEARTTSVSGISLAFLRAGVPAVLANLWKVEDGSGPSIREFYKELNRGASVPEALREAILADSASLKSGGQEPWMVMVPYIQGVEGLQSSRENS